MHQVSSPLPELLQRRAELAAELSRVDELLDMEAGHTQAHLSFQLSYDREHADGGMPSPGVSNSALGAAGAYRLTVGEEIHLVPSIMAPAWQNMSSMQILSTPPTASTRANTTLTEQPSTGEISSASPPQWNSRVREADFSDVAEFFFTASPSLPSGLRLDSRSGIISGVLEEMPADGVCKFQVSAHTSSRCSIDLQVASEAEVTIDEDFATRLEACSNVADILPEPSRNLAFGDWMIWMVHRAWLNDPALVELDFSNMHMPPPHVEPRIAPKLMAAVSWNSHIEVLCLSNANLQRSQGVELAQALSGNTTLRSLNIESNCLDSTAVREIALAIRDNKDCPIENLYLAHQKQAGMFFGRPTEEALGRMMQSNETIVKLGLECDDAHWRNVIDRALLRNGDFMRRRLQQKAQDQDEDVKPAEERTIGAITLCGIPVLRPASSRGACAEDPPGPCTAASSAPTSPGPSTAASAIVSEDEGEDGAGARRLAVPTPAQPWGLLRDYVLRNLKLPTPPQLQNYARNGGGSAGGGSRSSVVPYSVAAPLIQNCRSRLLDAAVGTEMVATDMFGVDAKGSLRRWSETNGHWTFDVAGEDARRYAFRSTKEPAVSVSEAWAEWLIRQDVKA